jgi:hypothetical protein
MFVKRATEVGRIYGKNALMCFCVHLLRLQRTCVICWSLWCKLNLTNYRACFLHNEICEDYSSRSVSVS